VDSKTYNCIWSVVKQYTGVQNNILLTSPRYVPMKCITCHFLTTFIITFGGSSLRTRNTVQVVRATVLTTDHLTDVDGMPTRYQQPRCCRTTVWWGCGPWAWGEKLDQLTGLSVLWCSLEKFATNSCVTFSPPSKRKLSLLYSTQLVYQIYNTMQNSLHKCSATTTIIETSFGKCNVT